MGQRLVVHLGGTLVPTVNRHEVQLPSATVSVLVSYASSSLSFVLCHVSPSGKRERSENQDGVWKTLLLHAAAQNGVHYLLLYLLHFTVAAGAAGGALFLVKQRTAGGRRCNFFGA